MNAIDFENAYFIKMGRGGAWEKAGIEKGTLRLGWGKQNLEDINQGNWKRIEQQLRAANSDQGAATRDLHALQWIVESTEKDIWITFYSSCLWWCRVGQKKIYQDNLCKYRKLYSPWSDKDAEGKVLLVNQIPGTISKVQGFRGTVCRVKEKDDLRRLLNHQSSNEYLLIDLHRKNLIASIQDGVRKLHWKDFELLVDLLFRQSGWRRLTTVGEKMKYVDIELEDPITDEMYQVQVKSKASTSEFRKYAEQFGGGAYRKLFFVVHSPDKRLSEIQTGKDEQVQLVLPGRIAEMVVDLGLVEWLMNKIR